MSTVEHLMIGTIEQRMRADKVPGLSVAVVAAGAVRWVAGFGTADLATGAAATPDMAYLWFSMTKVATATAVLRLAEQGLLDLDAPAQRYYPPFAIVRQPRPVTVRHLLSHSSGLANPVPIRWVYPAGAPPPQRDEFVARLLRRHRRLHGVPGVQARYSNLGYLVLGEVIAAVSGMPYEQYVRAQVLDPLGMRHTGFGYAETGTCPRAVGYQPLPRGLTPLLRTVLPHGIVAGRAGRYVAYHPFCVSGAAYGGLVGPVTDAARLALAHLCDGALGPTRLLSEQSSTQMRHRTASGRRDVGLGWNWPHRSDAEPGYVEHLGGGSGFFTAMRLYPRRRIGVVLMGNTTRYDHDAILRATADAAW